MITFPFTLDEKEIHPDLKEHLMKNPNKKLSYDILTKQIKEENK